MPPRQLQQMRCWQRWMRPRIPGDRAHSILHSVAGLGLPFTRCVRVRVRLRVLISATADSRKLDHTLLIPSLSFGNASASHRLTSALTVRTWSVPAAPARHAEQYTCKGSHNKLLTADSQTCGLQGISKPQAHKCADGRMYPNIEWARLHLRNVVREGGVCCICSNFWERHSLKLPPSQLHTTQRCPAYHLHQDQHYAQASLTVCA